MAGNSVSSADCATVGYEGRDVDEFIETLRREGVRQIVDVRERAISRKPGFSGRALGARLYGAGIDYRHIPELGSPSEIRARYRETGDFEAFSARYRDHLQTHAEFLPLLMALIAVQYTALLCFERDSGACHRSLICSELESEGLSFTHL